MVSFSPKATHPTSASKYADAFLAYARSERGLSPETILKYEDCLRQAHRMLGERDLSAVDASGVSAIKCSMLDRGLSVSRQRQILYTLRTFLLYCRDVCGIAVLDPAAITFPKNPRRDVLYLTPDEIERFLGTVKLKNYHWPYGWNLWGLRFRTLVEVILGSGLRISEVLSLRRDLLDPKTHEVKIVGKGRKERTAFITDRAFYWIEQYTGARTDNHPSLFVTQDGKRTLPRADVWRSFDRHRRLAGIIKPITPHILRHTAATQLLFNGCPIGHIKEILGHSRLETTCRYYLGLDHRAAKAAHLKYLTYGQPAPAEQQRPTD